MRFYIDQVIFILMCQDLINKSFLISKNLQIQSSGKVFDRDTNKRKRNEFLQE